MPERTTETGEGEIPVSEQLRRYDPSSTGALARYRELVCGDSGWLFFAGFELYNLLVGGLGSVVGYGLRKVLLPAFLQSCGKGVVLGRGVLLRQPRAISFGSGVIVEDYVALDARRGATGGSITLGDRVFLGRATILAAKGGTIELADGANIGSQVRIATQSSVRIGKGALVAAYAYIGPGNHQIDRLDVPIVEQPMEIKGGVDIGDNVWIGTRATVLDGVTIGANAVVGAHALVTADVPENAVVAGCPARILRYRG